MVSPDEHKSFFKFIGNNWMDPLYTMHYLADAPIELKVLFYVGESHMEKAGMGRMPPGVHLYSKKVLIERNSKHLLPDWMRFVQGVVDSEDIPLSISRESMQDSSLMQRVKGVLTKRFIKYLDDQAKSEPKVYNKDFWPDFGQFIREGACSDFVHKEAIAKLLRFHTTTTVSDGNNDLTSLEEYVSRSKPSQQNIYYLAAPSVEQSQKSPYMEIFKRNNLEVLILTHPIDEFVMNAVQSFNGRNFKSAESDDLDLDTATKEAEKELESSKKNQGTNYLCIHIHTHSIYKTSRTTTIYTTA
jgi:TNF receptor-associated protein 1